MSSPFLFITDENGDTLITEDGTDEFIVEYLTGAGEAGSEGSAVGAGFCFPWTLVRLEDGEPVLREDGGWLTVEYPTGCGGGASEGGAGSGAGGVTGDVTSGTEAGAAGTGTVPFVGTGTAGTEGGAAGTGFQPVVGTGTAGTEGDAEGFGTAVNPGIARRRGRIRPVSDLLVSEAPVWTEVQDADGTMRRLAVSSLTGGWEGLGPTPERANLLDNAPGQFSGLPTTALNARDVTSYPVTQDYWDRFEYTGPALSYANGSFDGYRRIANNDYIIARTNVDVMTPKCRVLFFVFRPGSDQQSAAHDLCLFVPNTSLSTWDNRDFIRIRISTSVSPTFTLAVEWYDSLGNSTTLASGLTVTGVSVGRAAYVQASIDGGRLRVYGDNNVDWNATRLIADVPIPLAFLGPDGQLRPDRRRAGFWTNAAGTFSAGFNTLAYYFQVDSYP